jgi:hypothetical protein
LSQAQYSTLSILQHLAVLMTQFVSGFATSFLMLYVFFLILLGPQFLVSYYTHALPNLSSLSPPAAGFIVMYGTSPFLAAGFQVVRYKYGTMPLMKSTRVGFGIGVLMGGLLVAAYIIMLMLELSGACFGSPCRGGGGL